MIDMMKAMTFVMPNFYHVLDAAKMSRTLFDADIKGFNVDAKRIETLNAAIRIIEIGVAAPSAIPYGCHLTREQLAFCAEQYDAAVTFVSETIKTSAHLFHENLKTPENIPEDLQGQVSILYRLFVAAVTNRNGSDKPWFVLKRDEHTMGEFKKIEAFLRYHKINVASYTIDGRHVVVNVADRIIDDHYEGYAEFMEAYENDML